MSNVDYTVIGKKIKRKRMEAGLTQEKLAEICNISTSYLGHIERGSRRLSIETAVKIADFLNISLDILFLDNFDLKPNILINFNEILKKYDPNKVERFLKTVKILIENIDKM
jgi:transcriptional regulator with XRE-family HTH domain